MSNKPEFRVGVYSKLEFTPAESKKGPSELERLVATANAGIDAINELHRKFHKHVQYESAFPPHEWADVLREENGGIFGKYRVKPKESAFASFTTSNGWLVEMKGDVLHIGCREYEAKPFREMLNRFKNDSNTYHDGPKSEPFMATRKGLMHGGHILAWVDADELLKRLEEAGV